MSAPAMEPDAAEQAVHAASLVPTDADKADVDAAREWERRVRADERTRIAGELDRLGQDYAAVIARLVPVDPEW